jgi:hypothetical protein
MMVTMSDAMRGFSASSSYVLVPLSLATAILRFWGDLRDCLTLTIALMLKELVRTEVVKPSARPSGGICEQGTLDQHIGRRRSDLTRSRRTRWMSIGAKVVRMCLDKSLAQMRIRWEVNVQSPSMASTRSCRPMGAFRCTMNFCSGQSEIPVSVLRDAATWKQETDLIGRIEPGNGRRLAALLVEVLEDRG